MVKKIHTDKAPKAIGPYSQAYMFGNVLLTSGQIPICPVDGSIVGSTIVEQTEQVIKNVSAILAECGMGPENVIKTTCFLSDMSNFAEFNNVYATFFTSNPARSCVAVKELPKQVLCEIEVVAVKES